MNQILKTISKNLMETFSNWKNNLIFLLSLGLISFLFFYFSNFELMEGNFGIAYVRLQIILQTAISILFALFITISIHKFFKFNTLSFKENSIGTTGTFLGILVAGCPACSVTLASYIGLAGVVSFLPWYGLELKILSIPLLFYANYSLLKHLNTCNLTLKNK